MKYSTLEILCCPKCQGTLAFRGEYRDDTVGEGTLFCPHCDREYALEDDIPRFISPHDLEGLNLRFARFYERYSRFEAIFDKLSFLPMGGERKARMEILQRLEFNNCRTLEVSIGTGGNLPYLFEFSGVGEVYGLDISNAQLSRCRRMADSKGWPVELFLGKAEELPFRADTFDCVFHIGGINFFSDKKKAVQEMIRVARPGTRIVIADESERVARLIARIMRLSRSNQGKELDTSTPVHLVPETMEEMREDGIWKRHGHYHGYCIEFRKPM